MTLLVSPRCYRHIGGAQQESVNEAVEPQQVLQGPDQLRFRIRAWGRFEIGPFSGNQRLAAVRQDENELQAAAHVRMPEDLQGPSFERMMWTRDLHSLGEVPRVGSVR
jgi:hypothetical protein